MSEMQVTTSPTLNWCIAVSPKFDELPRPKTLQRLRQKKGRNPPFRWHGDKPYDVRFTPQADTTERGRHVRFVPIGEIAASAISGNALGRELISMKPNSDGCELDKCEVVGGELVVSCRNASTVLDLVEEPLD